MRTLLFVMVTLGLAIAGCATREEWSTWHGHPAHFASAEHMVFSLHNAGAGRPRATRQDFALARDEGWWGKAVTVRQDDILGR